MSDKCSIGRDRDKCCAPDAWENVDMPYIRYWGEPLPVEVSMAAVAYSVDPHDLDWHVEAIHGWEPHDVGYGDHVHSAAECMQRSGYLQHKDKKRCE